MSQVDSNHVSVHFPREGDRASQKVAVHGQDAGHQDSPGSNDFWAPVRSPVPLWLLSGNMSPYAPVKAISSCLPLSQPHKALQPVECFSKETVCVPFKPVSLGTSDSGWKADAFH